MRHRHGYRKLGRESSHRAAMLRNMTTSLVEHGRIQTTLPKAKELRGVVEKLITKARKQDLANSRAVGNYLFTKEATQRALKDLSQRFKERPGGYTRIVRLGTRFGDGAQICHIEFVDYQEREGKLKAAAKDRKIEREKASAEQTS